MIFIRCLGNSANTRMSVVKKKANHILPNPFMSEFKPVARSPGFATGLGTLVTLGCIKANTYYYVTIHIHV